MVHRWYRDRLQGGWRVCKTPLPHPRNGFHTHYSDGASEDLDNKVSCTMVANNGRSLYFALTAAVRYAHRSDGGGRARERGRVACASWARARGGAWRALWHVRAAAACHACRRAGGVCCASINHARCVAVD